MKKIYFVCDDNYLYPLLFTIYSMYTSRETKPISIVLVADPKNFSENSQQIFKEIGILLNVAVEVKFHESTITQNWIGHVSPAAFLKCFILTFDHLPDDYLISDVDVLYKKGWDVNLGLK